MKIRIDDGWEFTSHWDDAFLEGSGCECTVRIPHTVKELPLHYIDPADYQMTAGYRRHLSFDESEKDMRHFIRFDGAAHIADVWFNGTYLGTHRSGYTAFSFEITKYIHFGEDNVVTVRLDTTENGEIPPFGYVVDYLTFGGIYRHVWIEKRPQLMIADAYITTPDLHTAVCELKMDGPYDHETLSAQVTDSEGRVIGSYSGKAENCTFRMRCPDAEAWEIGHPVLYTCTITAGSDQKQITFGFRTVRIDENHFYLNEKEVFIRGLNRHQCYPYTGYAVSDSLQVEDARILKEELGVNAVRTSHYPQSHAFIDACDRLGLLVFTEIPGWQHIGDEAWQDQAVVNTEEMVLEYRQHPSIVIWGVRINESVDNDALYQRTNETAHRLDPTRPTSGVRYIENSSLLEDIYAYNDFSHSGANPGCKPKKDVTKEKKPLMITEANGHMFPTKSFDPWLKRQEHALRHARVLNAAMADGEHMGCFQWCMFDYPTHKDFGSGDRICYHGVMDSFRNPKMAASVYAAQQDDTPVLEVGSPMDIGDYAAGNLSEIYAFTNADSVRLYKNGQYVRDFVSEGWNGLKHGPVLIDDTIGCLIENNEGFTGAKEKYVHEALQGAAKYGMADLPVKYKSMLAWCMLRYGMTYEKGVELYGKYVGNWGGDAVEWRFDAMKDGRPVKTVIKSPNTKLHLDVKCSSDVLYDSDTYDMAAVRIVIRDANGNNASYAQLPIHFSISGPIEIVGPETVTAEGGMCGTYLRTTGESGEAALTIHADGIEDVTVRLICKGGNLS